jgi:hypothetical protein
MAAALIDAQVSRTEAAVCTRWVFRIAHSTSLRLDGRRCVRVWRRSDAVARTHEGLFRPDADLPEEQAAYDKHVEETYTPEWFKTATRID